MLRFAAILLFLVLCMPVAAHGPTKCVGTAMITSDSLTIDVRFGIGLLHEYLDPDDDALVSDSEFTSGMPPLREIILKEALVKSADTTRYPKECTISVTDGSEIKVLMHFEPVPQSLKPAFALPFLKRLPGVPPAIISVWDGMEGAVPPTPIFFSQELPLDTSKRFQ